MKILYANANKLKIKIKSDSVMMNTFRRLILSEIPSIAIDVVHIYQNESPMDDSNLSHRIGMIPLLGSIPTEFNSARECSCDLECNLCSIFFNLDVTNYNEEIMEVTSNDFTKSKGFSFLPNISICHLAPKATLHIKVKGILGYGKDHVKWSHVSVPTFYPFPKISFEIIQNDSNFPSTDVLQFYRSKVVCNFSRDTSRCFDLDGKTLRISNSDGNMLTTKISVKPETSYIFSFETIKTNNAKETFNSMQEKLHQKITNLKNEIISILKS